MGQYRSQDEAGNDFPAFLTVVRDEAENTCDVRKIRSSALALRASKRHVNDCLKKGKVRA